MDAASPETVTVLLNDAREGDHKAKEQLFHLVEHELRAIARRQMREERPDHSLQATVLIDDVFLRLLGDQADINWESRKHFFRTAAHAMRRMLIDHERRRRAQRRGGGEHHRVPLDPHVLAAQDVRFDVLALDEALTKLAKIDPRQSEIVVLHHFGGFTLHETSKMLGVSLGTVKADWRIAKAWLHRELTRDVRRGGWD